MTAWNPTATIYRGDVLGALGLVVLGAAAWWLVLIPWQQTWGSYRELTAQRAAVAESLHADLAESQRSQQKLAWLADVVGQEVARVPDTDSLSPLLRQMTDLAKESHVELLSVAPEPMTSEGTYAVTDIRLVARAGSHDFIRFLDRLAQRNPHQSLQTCSLRHPAGREEPTCEIACTTRFYMLPVSASRDSEGAP